MELDFIKEMFDSIAPKYDFLNRFLSLGQDVLWRREMVKAAALPDKSMVLDVACGTCDVAIEVKKQKGMGAAVFATDFSPGMLFLGKQKVESGEKIKSGKGMKKGIKGENNIHLAAGNALCLPFKEDLFDGVFIAFGIRNIMDRKGGLQAFHKMLKKGGKLAVLELTSPPDGFFKDIYMFYFQRILPAIGGVFSKNLNAYHYLPESVLKFPPPQEFAGLMGEAGFENVRWKGMTLGIVTLFVGNSTGDRDKI